MCGWKVSVDDVFQRHGTPSQTEPASTPEAIWDQQSSGGSLREVSMYGGTLDIAAGTAEFVTKSVSTHAEIAGGETGENDMNAFTRSSEYQKLNPQKMVWASRCRAVAKLVYVTNTSLDGYIEDQYGAFNWAPPDDDVFAATTALLRSFGTFLYGRRLYEAMAVWETNPAIAEQSDLTADFASAWRAADKVVYSTTLAAVPTATTRLERRLRPRRRPRTEGRSHQQPHHRRGEPRCPGLRGRPVDECQLFVWPMILGGGKPALPAGFRTELELLDEHRFDNGVVHLSYRIPT